MPPPCGAGACWYWPATPGTKCPGGYSPIARRSCSSISGGSSAAHSLHSVSSATVGAGMVNQAVRQQRGRLPLPPPRRLRPRSDGATARQTTRRPPGRSPSISSARAVRRHRPSARPPSSCRTASWSRADWRSPFVDHLGDDRLALGDLAPAPVHRRLAVADLVISLALGHGPCRFVDALLRRLGLHLHTVSVLIYQLKYQL